MGAATDTLARGVASLCLQCQSLRTREWQVTVDKIHLNPMIGIVQLAEAGPYNWWGSCGLTEAGKHALGAILPHDCLTSGLFQRCEPVADASFPSGDGIAGSVTYGAYVCGAPRPTTRSAASTKWNEKEDHTRNTNDVSRG